MGKQKFTHLLLPQCKSQPSSCLKTNLKYRNPSSSVFVPLLSSFLQQPQQAHSHSGCDCRFFVTFYNGSFLLWQVRVLVSSWEHRASTGKVWLWLDSDLSASPPAAPQPSGEAAAAVMDLAQRRGRLKNKAGEQNHCMSDFWATVLSQVWTRLDDGLFLV